MRTHLSSENITTKQQTNAKIGWCSPVLKTISISETRGSMGEGTTDGAAPWAAPPKNSGCKP